MKYQCSKCKAENVKLWRQYQTFNPKLLCVVCACRDQEVEGCEPEQFNAEGFRTDKDGDETDQIGWLVSAIPADGGGFWGTLPYQKSP